MGVEKSPVGDVEDARQRSSSPSSEMQRSPTLRPSSTPPLRSESHLEPDKIPSTRQDPPKAARSSSILSSWWWWWEIGSSAISVVSIVLLVVLLVCIDKTPVSAWDHSLRPNTIISITTTAARTTMMVAVTACISQLKWRHYFLRSDRLSHLQIFDNASRGPWGAAKALLVVKTRAWLILALAAVTLVDLAMEPTAQQILDMAQSRMQTQNNTGEIAVAYDYESYSIDSYGSVTPNALFVRSTLLQSFIGQVFQPNSNCFNSTSFCSFTNVTTLAVCRDTRNLSGQVPRKSLMEQVPSTGQGPTQRNQTRYTYSAPRLTAPSGAENTQWQPGPNDLEVELIVPRSGSGENSPTNQTSASAVALAKTLFNSTAKMELPDQNRHGYNEGVSYVFLRLPDDAQVVHGPDYEPEPEIYMTRWYYCSQTFGNIETNSSGVISVEDVTSRPLVFESSSDNSSTAKTGFNIYSDGSGTLYNISFANAGTMWHTLANLLTSKNLQLREDLQGNRNPKKETTDDSQGFGQFLYVANKEDFLENIAVTATNLVRSGWSWNGDNGKAFMISGETFREELYFVVRWPWVVLPVAEVVVIALLLGLSIRKTRDQPLLKDSIAAYLLYGLHGWTKRELDALLPDDHSMESLEEASKDMVASLVKDDQGRLRFKKDVTRLNRRTTLKMLYPQVTHRAILGDSTDIDRLSHKGENSMGEPTS